MWLYLRGVGRHPGRAVALWLVLSVAAGAFGLLTASAATTELATRGEVTQHFRASYDLLVRPTGSTSELERSRSLVRNNFISGLYGGITVAEWRQVKATPGVDIAAPLANLGWVPLSVDFKVPMSQYLHGRGLQAFWLRSTSDTDDGLSTYPGPSGFFVKASSERQCAYSQVRGPEFTRPFVSQGPRDVYSTCATTRSPDGRSAPMYLSFPLLLAAIDPVEESRLLGIDKTVRSGRMLTEEDGVSGTYPTIPVMVSSRSFLEEGLDVVVSEIHARPGESLADLVRDPQLDQKEPVAFLDQPNRPYRRLVGREGVEVGSETFSISSLYRKLVAKIGGDYGPFQVPAFSSYWTTSPVVYQGRDVLTPQVVQNEAVDVWRDSGNGGYANIPIENGDVQFRGIRGHDGQSVSIEGTYQDATVTVNAIGTFDPLRLPGFDPLTRVPLETYTPPTAVGADRATREALGDEPLSPTREVAGYLSQPPHMFTTLRAARALTDRVSFSHAAGDRLISVIRVRVAGVTGADEASLARIRTVADRIRERTGLDVDITAGSSPTRQTIRLPAGKFGRPELLLEEGWTKKGVALAILTTADRKTVALVALAAVMTLAYAVNAGASTVVLRRRELGVLRCCGWRVRDLRWVVLAEAGLVGIASAATAALLVWAGEGLTAVEAGSLQYAVAVTGAGLAALGSGLVAAHRSARVTPVSAVVPAVDSARRTRWRPSALTAFGFAATSLMRRPVRAVTAAAIVGIGVASLATVLTVRIAFDNALVDSVLGEVVVAQTRTADLAAIGIILMLGVVALADLVVMSMRERQGEMSVLRAVGWSERRLMQVSIAEGVLAGTIGALVGGVVGLAFGAVFGGAVAPVLEAVALACGIGILAATAAAAVPAIRGRTSAITSLMLSE